MAAGSRAGWALVGWAALALGAMELAILAFEGAGQEGVRLGIRATARTSLLLFLLAFSASSLQSAWRSPASKWLLRNRRYVGVSFAVSQAYHIAGIAVFAQGWPDAFDAAVSATTLIGGGVGYVFTAVMAATSSDAAVRRLGRARWKALHRTGIWVLWVIFLVSYGPRAFGDPFSIPPALAVLAAAGLRLYARADRRGVASPAGRAGPTA